MCLKLCRVAVAATSISSRFSRIPFDGNPSDTNFVRLVYFI